jgi:DNA replication ATP-dependent helicase Dna2
MNRMRDDAFRDSFLKFIKALDHTSLTDQQKLSRLFQLFKFVVTQVTDATQIQFTSLYSRLSYIISNYNIPGKESYVLHAFRKYEQSSEPEYVQKYYAIARLGMNIIGARILEILPIYKLDIEDIFQKYFKSEHRDVQKYLYYLPVFMKKINKEAGYIMAQSVEAPFDTIRVSTQRADQSEDFYPMIMVLDTLNQLPIQANLIDIEVDTDGLYHPASIVLEPDYLFDVTAISECFGADEVLPLGYILRRFVNRTNGVPLLIGNIANFFLDQLIFHPEIEFKDVQKRIFQLDPLSLVALDDEEVKEMIKMLKRHFENLKRVVSKELQHEGFIPAQSYIEPAFYSALYGIQGRLDLFVLNDTSANILELKSGSPFRANRYGLSNSHYHQTLLYDMLVESVYGKKVIRKNFILYSKELGNNLRYAPSIKAQQRETIKLRNTLYLTDLEMRKSDDILTYLTNFYNKYQKSIKGYQLTDIREVIKTFEKLTPTESMYCQALISFVLNEHQMSKLGDDSKERLTGLASLWRDDLSIKIEQFNILNHLNIVSDQTNSDDPILILGKTEVTAELSNFRVGDLAVLYRDQNRKESILMDQVFKCTILETQIDFVKIRLRSRQENTHIFSGNHFWNIEHDSLENGFYAMTRSVFEYAGANDYNRRLLIGEQSPAPVQLMPVASIDEMTEEQNQLFQEIISAQDYYLLWGPPGTGKTSILLKYIARYYYESTTNRILLLSYTNRAVDEICHALSSIDNSPEFIRIGSKYSTDVDYTDTLLNEQLLQINNRKDLKNHLKSCRIYVGTVASILGKPALFDILDFQVAIIDEASQILDASLIGLLTRVKKFVLIGDHLQLPAVVLQDIEKTRIVSQELNQLGISNLANSLFERLFLHAQTQGWKHAYGQLSHQGRLHEELMEFPNEHFYQGTLKPLYGLKRLSKKRSWKSDNPIEKALAEHRYVFIPTDIDLDSDNIKVNEHEADRVVEVLQHFERIYQKNDLQLNKESIGIIAPYRAQIARIIKNMQEVDLQSQSMITVDTVERYQGGARDIILLTASINFSFQMRSLISLSDEGIDRKLNVAFTRAREQFILIGNEAILRENKVYANLIDRSFRLLWDESIDPDKFMSL